MSATSPHSDSLPLIDVSALFGHHSSATDLTEVATEIDDACRSVGFFSIVGHGVPTALQARLEAASHDFFARTVGGQLSTLYGQRVVAENRAGAGGLIGIGFYLLQQLSGHLAGILGLNPSLLILTPAFILLIIAIAAIRHHKL